MAQSAPSKISRGAAPPAKQGYICVDSKQARANHTPNHTPETYLLNMPRIIPPDATRFADTGIFGNSHMLADVDAC